MPQGSRDRWPTPDELARYAAHAPVLAQGTAFLTHITTTASLYATVTGAAWGVVFGNTFGASVATLLWLLGLHGFLSVGVAVGIWGVGNNFIQRLNFARWLGVAFWPTIERIGGADYAWRGVPVDNPDTRWRLDGTMVRTRLRYRAWLRPSLRHQRLWALLPALAGAVSLVFAAQIAANGDRHRKLCRAAAATLGAPAPSREALERARYLFDKAGCSLSHVHLGGS